MKLSIVVPCYNEEKNIPLVLERFKSVIKRDDVEIIIVNNGSVDNSAIVLEKMLPDYPFVKVVTVQVNQGYGFGILSGLNAAQGQYIGWTHADMQTDPIDVIKALELIEQLNNPNDIYVKGLRKGRPLFDEFFTVGMSLFESILLGCKLWDINAQPNIFHRSLFESWKDAPYDFSLDLFALYTAQKSNFKIKRINVIFPERVHGYSSWNNGLASKWKFIKRTVDYSFKLRKELKK